MAVEVSDAFNSSVINHSLKEINDTDVMESWEKWDKIESNNEARSVKVEVLARKLSEPLSHLSDHNTSFDYPGYQRHRKQRFESFSNKVPSNTTEQIRLSAVSILDLILLTSFNFTYGLICGTFALWILPAEASWLFPQTQSLTLGLSLGIVGVTQLICPIAGKVSDLHVSSTLFGKRKPYIFWGSMGAVVFTLGMWESSLYSRGYIYYFCLFGGMSCLNITYSVQCGLVPDFLEQDVQGRSSGLVAVHTLIGSGSGFALVILTSESDFHFVYPMYIVLIVISCIITCTISNTLERRIVQKQLSQLYITDISNVDNNLPSKNWIGMEHDMSTGMQNSTVLNDDIIQCTGIVNKEKKNSLSQTIELVNNRQAIMNEKKHGAFLQVSSFDDEDNDFTLSQNKSSLQKGIFNNDTNPYSLIKPNNNYRSNSSNSWDSASIRGQHNHYSHNTTDFTNTIDKHTTVIKGHLYHSPDCTHTLRKTKLKFSDILDSFCIDTSETYDFFWVFIGRTLYYIGVSVQVFMFYFLRDVVGTADEPQRRLQVGCLALTAQTTAALVAYPVGHYTDSPNSCGRKPLIYLGCCCMSAVYIAFLFASKFSEYAFYFVLGTAAIYGAGNGCFLAVDYALALATIPKSSNVTQALGIWGVSGFIGSSLGPLIWGVFLETFGRDPITGNYMFQGYVAILFGGIAATIGAGAVIKMVRSAT